MFSTSTGVFVNQKGINVREQTVKMVAHLFTYIYSLLIDKHPCESRNISIKFPCALHPETSSFFESFPLFLFLSFHTSVLSFSTLSQYYFLAILDVNSLCSSSNTVIVKLNNKDKTSEINNYLQYI